MVRILIGNLFESTAQTLVNTVNTVGVMGKGIALEFKNRFPDMYDDYRRRCAAKDVRLGQPYLYKRLMPPWILNFPTKENWRSVTKLQDIINGMVYLQQHYREWGIESLAVPPLGCGLGQLEWRVVGPTLYRHLVDLELSVELYAPFGTPHEELQPEYLGEQHPTQLVASPQTRINPAWVALVEVLKRIEAERFHRPIGRVTFQKIAYFATRLGIPTGLDYARGSFGPFAPTLKNIQTRLVNNGLIREEPLGGMFRVRVGPTYDDARKAYVHDLGNWDDAIERVTDLFLRMPTRDAEAAATVHFVANELSESLGRVPIESEVLDEVMRWKQRRKPPLKREDVAKMNRSLNMLGWVRLTPSTDLPVSKSVLVGM